MGNSTMRVFLAGDFEPARGVDNVMPKPTRGELREGSCTHAAEYVMLAERRAGARIDRTHVTARSLIGDLPSVVRLRRPIAHGIINLETAVTRCDDFAPKAVNYRASEENVAMLLDELSMEGINVACIANNHVFDFGARGFADTLNAARRVTEESGGRFVFVGGGRTVRDATAPVIVGEHNTRAAVFAMAFQNSGTPLSWSADETSSGMGVAMGDYRDRVPTRTLLEITRAKASGAMVIVSIHFGSNWGWEIDPENVTAARALIDAGADIVHGHSSHHPRTAELYKNKLILYGCGEMFNDYEGIGDHPGFPASHFLGDLRFAYFVDVDTRTGDFVRMFVHPMKQKLFRLHEGESSHAKRFQNALAPQYAKRGLRVEIDADDDRSLKVTPIE